MPGSPLYVYTWYRDCIATKSSTRPEIDVIVEKTRSRNELFRTFLTTNNITCPIYSIPESFIEFTINHPEIIIAIINKSNKETILIENGTTTTYANEIEAKTSIYPIIRNANTLSIHI